MSEPALPGDGNLEGPLAAGARILVSDADRLRVADVLGDAYAEGRLTPVEHDERLTATMAARTVADLVPVLEGLPPAAVAGALAALVQASAPAASAPAQAQRWSAAGDSLASPTSAVAVFGSTVRKGDWVVPAQLTAVAVFGSVELDLTAATFAGAQSEIVTGAIFGEVTVKVPEGLAVQVDGVGVFGEFDQRAGGPGEPGAPTLRVRGGALFGSVAVKRRPRRLGPGSAGRPGLP